MNNQKCILIIALVLALSLLTGCATATPAIQSTAIPTIQPTKAAAPAVEWQTYTNAEAGYSIDVPTTWSQQTLPDQNDGYIHGESYTGPEGGVEVHWGIGFGGACPTGTVPVQLAQGEQQACYTKNDDGTEDWNQIGYIVEEGNSFSVHAYTSNAEQSSQDIVLQVLSTLTFMPAATTETISTSSWQWFVDQAVGYAIEVPPNWTQQTLPDQNDGNIHGESYTGTEGGVEVYWGIGFGGACPTGTDPVMLATGEAQSCHIKKNDGTQEWNQIGYEVEAGNFFSVRAYTSNPQPSSQDLVLHVLSTLTFQVPTTGTIEPLSMEVCDGQAQAMSHTLDDLIPTQSEELMNDPVNDAWGTGCQATITGTGVTFESPQAASDQLASMLESQGYTEDMQLAGDGPTGTSKGYRNGDQLCLTGAGWWPDASANCPTDQAISACNVTPEQQDYTITLLCGVETLGGATTGGTGMANPASENCIEQGGTLSIEENGNGDQYGVCYFEDNYQCEEWAMLRGDCPVGGIKVTGYITPAATYCAITGGTYQITGNNGADDEQGTCTLPDGTVCDVWEYYNGQCSAASPSGTTAPGGGAGQIVFDSDRGGDQIRNLYVMNSDGMDVSQLTQGDSNSFAGPWSPDGQRILYIGFGLTNSYIAVINADGSGQTIIDQVDGSDEGFPDWSPDGQQIAFTSRRDGNNEIYLMSADGSTQLRLTNEPGDDFAPSWSPDGSKIVFVSDRDQKAGVTDLYIMNADGSGVTRLTNDDYLDYAPDWSPDGQKIAYRSDRDGNSDIYVINVDGSGETRLTEDPAYDWSPQWSPDGTLIAFQSKRDGNFEIYTMAADGANPVNLTNDPSDDQMPFWRP